MDIKLVPAIEAKGREAVREIVSSGAGVGIVSEAEFGHDERLFQIPPITNARIQMDEALICLHERCKGRRINAFISVARAAT